MKRPPRAGERGLMHTTTNTDDIQVFAICDENFDPFAVAATLDMLEKGVEIVGFRLHAVGENRFLVECAAGVISENSVEKNNKGDVSLTTSLLPNAVNVSRDILLMAADLEQCAAIALFAREEQP